METGYFKRYTTEDATALTPVRMKVAELESCQGQRLALEFYRSIQDTFSKLGLPHKKRWFENTQYNLDFFNNHALQERISLILTDREFASKYYLFDQEAEGATKEIGAIIAPSSKIGSLFIDVLTGRINPEQPLPLEILMNGDIKKFNHRPSPWISRMFKS